MLCAPLPSNEAERLEALHSYRILDSEPDVRFDNIVQLCQSIFDTEIASISLVDTDRQWFKASVGLDVRETGRDVAFCAHAIISDEVTVVGNATKDERFFGNPLVTGAPNIRFYAGAPLITPDGFVLGTICIIDPRPKATFSDTQVEQLRALARIVSGELELWKKRFEAEEANRLKTEFLANISHELRTPLNAIIGFSDLIAEDARDLESDTFMDPAVRINRAGKNLLTLVNDILDLSKLSAGKMELAYESVSVRSLIEDLLRICAPLAEKNANKVRLGLGDDVGVVEADPTRLRQVLINIVSNACKFTENGRIDVRAERQTKFNQDIVVIEVADNGIGIDVEKLDRIFGEFSQESAETSKKYGGTGLGLAISKRLVELMDGTISVDSAVGRGTTFTVVLPVSRYGGMGSDHATRSAAVS